MFSEKKLSETRSARARRRRNEDAKMHRCVPIAIASHRAMDVSARNADDVVLFPIVRKRKRQKRRRKMKRFFNDTSVFSSAVFGGFLPLVFVLLLLSLRCVREIECVDANDDDGGVTRKMNADSENEAFRRKKNTNDRYEEEAEYAEEEEEEEKTRRSRSKKKTNENEFAQLAGERGEGPELVALGPNAEKVQLSQFETRMMAGKDGKMFVSVLPEDRSMQCQERIDEWYPTFRKVARAMDAAYKVLEVNMPGRTAQAIGEVFGKMKKQEARKFACGVVGLYGKSGGLNILKGNYSDPVSYMELLSSARDGVTDLRTVGEKAPRFGSGSIGSSSSSFDDDGDNKHAACDWLARPRREGDAKMRVAVFEPVDEDVFNFIATVIGEKNAALFSRQSLFGCEVTVGQPVRESYGITLVADIDESDDEFNVDAEIKVMPIFANKNAGFNPRLGKEDFIDFLDKVILANATSAFREMVDTSIDHNCANDIWELMNNLNDQFYEEVARKKQQRQTQEDGEGEEGEDEHFTPEIAWDTIREPMLKALDAHGKNDKNLQPTQWMCGLAGSIAAFAEAKSELASANSFMGELMTLRKESIQLRTRNAVLERELAEMETRLPAGGANSGAMGLPKAKKRGFGAAPKETNTPPPTPTPSFDEEERLQRQQQKIQQQQEEEAEAATAAAAAAAAATREEEERQRQEREAVEAQRRREEEEERQRQEREAIEAQRRREEEEEVRQRQEREAVEAQRRREEEEEERQRQEREAIEAQRRREDREEEEEKERQRKEQEAAEAQRRQHEEAEALRTQREAEAAANIPPPPVEDEDPNLTFWSAHENQGKTYYYNSQTRESTYEKPVGFSEPEKVKNESPHVEL